MAVLCIQSCQSFLRLSAVGWGLRQGQTEKEKNRREQSQKESEPARIQVGSGRGTWDNAENICHHGLLECSQPYRGCTVPGGLMRDKDMLASYGISLIMWEVGRTSSHLNSLPTKSSAAR